MLNELKTRHREIARLDVENFTPIEIANRLGMHVKSVRDIMRDPLYKGFRDGLLDKADQATLDIRRELTSLQKPALDGLKYLLQGDGVPPATLLNTCKDVLDRTGYKPPERHEHLHGHFTSEDLKELQKRAREAKNVEAIPTVVESGAG